MIKILFVCHGNICRSACAEYVMRDMVQRAHMEGKIMVSSAATSTEEIGNPVYPPIRQTLLRHGIRCDGHSARQLTRQDYKDFDMLIGTDRENLYYMERICGGDAAHKFSLLMDYTGHSGREIADPWYTRDFEATYRDVAEGCTGLLLQLQKGGKKQ